MFEQTSQFFENKFLKYQYIFRKGFSTQPFLLTMLEKWRSSIDNRKIFDEVY